MKTVTVNLNELLEQVSEERIASAINSDLRAGDKDWDHDERHEHDDDDGECEWEEVFEGNRGLHLGIFIRG